MPLRSHILALCVASLSATSAFAVEVHVQGNKHVDAEAIAAHVPVREGSLMPGDIDEALKALFATGQFSDVSIDTSADRVNVWVVEKPRVRGLSVSGGKLLDRKALERLQDLGENKYWDEALSQSLANAVSQNYAAKGYPDATASIAANEDDNGWVDLTLQITEGERVPVARIDLSGNEEISDARLKMALSTRETGILSRLRQRDIYLPEKAEQDRIRLEAFYREQGYPAARVTLSDIDRDQDGFHLVYDIHEGDKAVFANATVLDDAGVTDLDLQRLVEGLVGKPVTPQIVDATARSLEEAVSRAGLPSVRVEPRLMPRRATSMDVEFRVTPTHRIYVDTIEIRGNQRTLDHVIRRELSLAEGDLVDLVRLRRSQQRLERLGFFKSVKIGLRPGNVADRASVLVEVEEQKTGDLSLGGGWSSSGGLLANISIAQANILGTGRAGRINAGRSDVGHSYGFSITEPRLLGSGISLTGRAYRSVEEFASAGRSDYDRIQTGAAVTARLPITHNLSATLGYSVRQREISNVDQRISGAFGGPVLVAPGRDLISAVSWSVLLDNLDNPRNPNEGYRLELGQEIAGIGGDVSYIKTEASAHRYAPLPLPADMTTHLSAKVGHVASLGQPLAFIDHFQSGPDLVRGFAKGGFGPRDRETSFALGGTAYVAASAELITPMPLLPEEAGLKLIGFMDAGTLWNPDDKGVSEAGATAQSDGFSLRSSMGMGVLWDSPFGPLRADLAFPLVSEEGDRTQAFTFSGGTRF